jgi:2Fe-2S ferredoxin
VIRKLLGKVREVARNRRGERSAADQPDSGSSTSGTDPIELPGCQVTFTDYDRTVAIHRGKTLLHAVIGAGVPLPHECGGLASCGECRVAKVEGEVSERREIETNILKILGKPLDGRLACQTLVFGEVSVTVADAE